LEEVASFFLPKKTRDLFKSRLRTSQLDKAAILVRALHAGQWQLRFTPPLDVRKKHTTIAPAPKLASS
jgi:hypothetical protein